MIQSPFEKDRVRRFEVVAVFGEAQLVKQLNGKFEILGGNDADRSGAREWLEMFIKPRATLRFTPVKLLAERG
jgi:hypothetical protein